MFVLTNTNANNNKFWEVTLEDDGTVKTRNGRVGTKGQSRTLGNGETLMNRKIREKERKGYKEIDVIGNVASKGLEKKALATAAEDQIAKGNPVVAELVRRLAEINRHQILQASGGQMDLDLSTGIVSTPLGVVTADNIAKARVLLDQLEPYVLTSDLDAVAFRQSLEQYLMLVPQKVSAKRGWHKDFITNSDGLIKQGGLLDQLESSIDVAKKRVADAEGKEVDAPADIFDVRMEISDCPDLRKTVEDFFQKGRQSMHASRNFRISRIFNVSLGAMDRDYDEDGAKVGGVMQLWHGTRAHNLLSILKSGLIIPKSSGSIHVTGRMFGDGLYFSDQSTKSLNYSYGYWDGGSRDNRCYMFLADVAMGTPWHPSRTGSNVKPPAGYDSVFARGGRDIVMNNEMIVYRTGQARLKHLIEFEQ
jgi:poly [ADP-ribose] polymerase